MTDDELLRQVTIAEPCSADWDAMPGDARARFCALCGKHVYDLEAMPADEAVCLIRSRGGNVCARLAAREAPGPAVPAAAPGLRRGMGRGQFHIRLIMAVIAGVGALLGLTRGWWRGEEPATPPNSQRMFAGVIRCPAPLLAPPPAHAEAGPDGDSGQL